LLALGLGETKEAIARLEGVRHSARVPNPAIVPWVYDLVEAYLRDGRTADAEELLDEHVPAEDELWAQAAAPRCPALLPRADDLEDAFQVALDAPACAA